MGSGVIFFPMTRAGKAYDAPSAVSVREQQTQRAGPPPAAATRKRTRADGHPLLARCRRPAVPVGASLLVDFISVSVSDQAITALRVIGNPEKLRHLARP